MPRADLISGSVMLVFGLVTLFYIIPTQTIEGGDYTISPALLPQICAVGIIVLALNLVIRSFQKLRALREAEQPERVAISGSEWVGAFVVLGVVAISVVLFRYVSTALAPVFLVLVLMLYMGERRPLLLVALPLGLLGAGYLLFYQVLGMAVG
ncbi:MAG: tripartite tricarboxylate transporter TctB family protein [Gammaproteobacteria bacterium]|nr:tripartite tricarboxylate transporter TctB family protein [Gammaproteobacteria bacterium]